MKPKHFAVLAALAVCTALPTMALADAQRDPKSIDVNALRKPSWSGITPRPTLPANWWECDPQPTCTPNPTRTARPTSTPCPTARPTPTATATSTLVPYEPEAPVAPPATPELIPQLPTATPGVLPPATPTLRPVETPTATVLPPRKPTPAPTFEPMTNTGESALPLATIPAGLAMIAGSVFAFTRKRK